MGRVDPQAGEPGPCIVRARGAREHGKDAPPSSLLTGAVGTIVDDTFARERNLKTSQLEGGIYLFGGCSTGLHSVNNTLFSEVVSEYTHTHSEME